MFNIDGGWEAQLQSPAFRGVAQPGSVPAWGAGGRRFKSSRPDQKKSGNLNMASLPSFLVSNLKY